MSLLALALPALLLTGCPQGDEAERASGPSDLEQQAIEKGCPTMSTVAGDYLLVAGGAPDHTRRFRIMDDGGRYTMWYTGGGFGARVMAGEKRDHDIQFTEVPDDRKKAAYEAGTEPLIRVYVEPRLEKCALRTSILDVYSSGGKQVEKAAGKTGFLEYVRFPENQEIAWQPCDGPAFLYDAAKDPKVAARQLEDLGTPKPDHMLGEAIPVAAWTDAAADGDPSCSFDMDLYFDDLPVQEGGKALPAGDVVDGQRHWLVPAWKAPYSGNHHFSIYRYRTCGGGERELIGVSCLEAVLM